MKTVPFLETTIDCGLLYPLPRVCCASTTTAGAAPHALEAQKTSVRTEKLNLHFHAEYFAENFDGIADMAAALLYDFRVRSSIVYGEGNSLQSI
jgi:hypothetical protein